MLEERGFDKPSTLPHPISPRTVAHPQEVTSQEDLSSDPQTQEPTEHLLWGVSQAPQTQQILISPASLGRILSAPLFSIFQ